MQRPSGWDGAVVSAEVVVAERGGAAMGGNAQGMNNRKPRWATLL